MSRCYNIKATGYNFYGGRGITVCDRWRESFWNFYDDMGIRKDGLSLDRINPNGQYCPENCRWATSKEQGNNTTSNYILEYEGISQNLSQWGELLGILPNTIYYRLARGWTPSEALEKSPRVPPWQHRLSKEQVQWITNEVLVVGRLQTDVAKEIGLHSSQVSRLCSRYGTNKEKQEKKNANKQKL